MLQTVFYPKYPDILIPYRNHRTHYRGVLDDNSVIFFFNDSQ